jgi:hypothetical protein
MLKLSGASFVVPPAFVNLCIYFDAADLLHNQELSLALNSGLKMFSFCLFVVTNVKILYLSQVHAQIAKLKRELSAHESEVLRLKSSAIH